MSDIGLVYLWQDLITTNFTHFVLSSAVVYTGIHKYTLRLSYLKKCEIFEQS